MEDNTRLIESLLERASEYGKTSYELAKLNIVDKTSDSISSFLPHSFIVSIIVSFLLFINLGVSLWLGELLGRIYYGFFIVAGFYALLAFVIHFLLRKFLKRVLYDYLIREMLK